MTFEYSPTVFGIEGIPDFCVPISELLKTLKYKTDEKAHAEREAFLQALRIYTYYCGKELTITSTPYDIFLKQIGKNGRLIISCIELNPNLEFLVRVVSNEGEKEIEFGLSEVRQGRLYE